MHHIVDTMTVAYALIYKAIITGMTAIAHGKTIVTATGDNYE